MVAPISKQKRSLSERIALVRSRRERSMFDLGAYDDEAAAGNRTNSEKSLPSSTSCPDIRMYLNNNDDDDQSFSLWRLNPEESHSDWTIVLHEEVDPGEEEQEEEECSEHGSTTEGHTTFHVHKSLLGVGPFRSEYFSRLFRPCTNSGGLHLSESETSISNIHLPQSAILAFPVMLDFIYSRGCIPSHGFKTSQAVDIRFLSTYFGVPKLYSAITQFIHSDLTTSTCIEYLTNARIFRDDKLVEASCATCAKTFEHLTTSQINSLSPDILQLVIGSPLLQCESEELSCRIAEYCRCHPDIIDGSWLRNVTSHSKMPRIFPEEALFLLNLAVKHLAAEEEVPPTQEQQQQQQAVPTPHLKERCISACSEYWTEVLLRSDTSFSLLPEAVKVELLLSALRMASKELDTANTELDGSKRQCRGMEQTIDRLTAEVQTHRRICAIHERKISQLEQQLLKKDQHNNVEEVNPASMHQ